MSEQPEALRLAGVLEALNGAKKLLPCVGGETLGTEVYRIRLSGSDAGELLDAAAELRRLYAVNAEMLEALQNIAATVKFAEEFKSDWCAAATGMVRMARASIARAEEVKP